MNRPKEFLQKHAEDTAQKVADFIVFNKLNEDEIEGFLSMQQEEVYKWLDADDYRF